MGKYYIIDEPDEPCFRPKKAYSQKSDRIYSIIGGFAVGLLLSNPFIMYLFNAPLQQLIISNYILFIIALIILLAYNIVKK